MCCRCTAHGNMMHMHNTWYTHDNVIPVHNTFYMMHVHTQRQFDANTQHMIMWCMCSTHDVYTMQTSNILLNWNNFSDVQMTQTKDWIQRRVSESADRGEHTRINDNLLISPLCGISTTHAKSCNKLSWPNSTNNAPVWTNNQRITSHPPTQHIKVICLVIFFLNRGNRGNWI